MRAQIHRHLKIAACLLLCISLQAADSRQLELYYGVAEGNYLIGDLQGASRSIEAILKIEPTYVPALKLKARIELKQGQTEAALAATQEALSVQPDDLELQILAARIQSDSEEPIAAIDQVLKVYEGKIQPEALQQRASLQIMRAQALAMQGDLDPAIRELQQLTGQQPENLEATITLASLYASAGRWSSLEALTPRLSAQPELEDIALYFEGRTLLARNRVGSAREKFEQALQLDNLDKLKAALHFHHGACLIRLGKKDVGQQEIIQALDAQFKPETEADTILASRSLLLDQQNDRAVALLEQITLRQPNSSAEAWSLLGRAHQAEGTTALAISAFNESLRIKPDQAEVRALRGAELRKLGDLTGAAADYEAARMLDPANPALLYALGVVQLQQGELLAAEQNIGLASRLLSDNAGIQLLHSLLAYAIDAPKTSQAALTRYFESQPSQINETAYFLEYALSQKNSLATLKKHADAPNVNQSLVDFYNFCSAQWTIKATLDAAGKASTPQIAAKQICRAAYWMAQHTRKKADEDRTNELLCIAIEAGNPDLPEYQLARWQLNATPLRNFELQPKPTLRASPASEFDG